MKNETKQAIEIKMQLTAEDERSFAYYVEYLASRAQYTELFDVEYGTTHIIIHDDCSSWLFTSYDRDGNYYKVEYVGDLFGAESSTLINCSMFEQFGTWKSIN